MCEHAGQLFNWHPLCMVIAFPVLMAEALLAYRAPYTAELQKWDPDRQ